MITLYEQAAQGQFSELTKLLWGAIPLRLGDLRSALPKTTINQSSLESLHRILFKHHQNLGFLTPEVERCLEDLVSGKGIIEVGHQTLFFGGPLFLPNKVFFTSKLAEWSNLVPLFYVADYDGVQNELTITRFPRISSAQGLALKLLLKDFENTSAPIRLVPRPKLSWILEMVDKVRETYNELFKASRIKGNHRPFLKNNLENILDIFWHSARQAQNFGQWSLQLMAEIFIRNRLPILILPASDPEFRKISAEGFEYLLRHRETYIEVENMIFNQLHNLDYTPRVSYRREDYVPFFLECPDCRFHSRTELLLREEGSDLIFEGQCPDCGTKHSISASKTHPDLSDHALSLSPRIDSRSCILSALFPVQAHVGGPGETEYYSQVIPAMRNIDLTPPIFIKYTRLFYNSPWSEKFGKELPLDCVLQTKEMFSMLGKYSKAESHEDILDIAGKMGNRVYCCLGNLLEERKELQEKIKKQRSKKDSRLLQDLELYLSMTYGFFAEEKTTQESSWSWSDLAILTGVYDLGGFIQRQMKPNLPPGQTLYISPGNFN
ncbi:MAG: bacillithiol biosynthesis BshC [Candidatus Hodarchaeota archaeon]